MEVQGVGLLEMLVADYGAQLVTETVYDLFHFPPRMITDMNEAIAIRKHIENQSPKAP